MDGNNMALRQRGCPAICREREGPWGLPESSGNNRVLWSWSGLLRHAACVVFISLKVPSWPGPWASLIPWVWVMWVLAHCPMPEFSFHFTIFYYFFHRIYSDHAFSFPPTPLTHQTHVLSFKNNQTKSKGKKKNMQNEDQNKHTNKRLIKQKAQTKQCGI